MNDGRADPTRFFIGEADQEKIRDGTEIVFAADEPPTAFKAGWAIAVVMPDGTRETLFAEPAHGPTHVGWTTRHGHEWVFPLTQVRHGLWRVQFDKRRRILTPPGDARGL